ncbi:MAG TPA: aldo/keto reductase [Thermoplasmata archaeon]|nr:aldo/keto reductase [Thermoplasmata archaeon]
MRLRHAVPRMPGAASPEGTGRFSLRAARTHRVPPEHFRRAPGGLVLSSMGLGSYIGPPDRPTDEAVEQAAQLCLQSGRINVLDTAINYRYQRAERSIGRGLVRAIDHGPVQREEVFVSTKVGYLAPDGESKVALDRWIETELVATEILDPADIVDDCHAMSVSYLRDQFERSRTNLGLDSIDLLYLHNAPDTQLPSVGHDEFVRRLTEAFGLFEELRSAGRLGAYGLATWDCLRRPRGSVGYFPLEEGIGAARAVGGEKHGLRFLQFPFSLGMPEAAVQRNQSVRGENVTLFEAAHRLGLGCFTSVPLLQGQLARVGPVAEGLSAAQTAIQFARSAPGTIGPLVGQKEPVHLAENLQLAERAPWALREFQSYLT